MIEERATIISKTLSRILRHNPHGIAIDEHGFADLPIIIAHMLSFAPFKDTGLSYEEVTFTVESDTKGRFHIYGGCIRALSGHSFPVEIEGEEFYPAGPLFFGTVAQRRTSILENGLSQGQKIKIRLSYSYQEALGIATARPHGEPFVAEVDAERLAADGWTFKLLPNGEIVTDRFGGDYVSEARDPKVVPLHRP